MLKQQITPLHNGCEQNMNILEEAIARNLQMNPSVECREDRIPKLARFTQYMLSENEKYNLTAITDPEKAALLHIVDSLSVLEYIRPGTLCDVGAGAGFPSLPLAIYSEELQVTALDATAKKTAFMNAAALEVGVPNFCAVNGRAEELFAPGMPMRESFDTVIARAVAPLNILCELCVPAVKVGGCFISMRGESAQKELEDYQKKSDEMSRKLGVVLEKAFPISLHGKEEDYSRFVIIFRKIHATDLKLSRSFANIKKKPLF